MSEQFRRPTGDQYVELTPVPSSPNYGNVDEETPNDADYNYKENNGGSSDVFTHSVFSVETAATCIIVKQRIRAKRTNEDYVMKVWGILILKDEDTTEHTYNSYDYLGLSGVGTLTTDWVQYEFAWVDNPGTGLPWTKDQVNGIGDKHLWAEGYGVGSYEA